MSLRLLPIGAFALFAPLSASLAAQDFGPERELAHPASHAQVSYVGDLDGDGDLDVVYGGHTTLAWFENRGPSGFAGARVLDKEIKGVTTFGYSSVTGADLDGDGDLDLAACSILGKTLAWFENEGGGQFGPAQVLISDSSIPYEVVAADFDGDGNMDLALASAGGQNVRVLLGLGGGAFGAAQVLTTLGDFYYALDVGDMDGDGDQDLVVGGFETIAYLENFGLGNFAPARLIESVSQTNRGLALVDFDGDGFLDVGSASSVGFYAGWYRNLGGGFFGPKTVLGTGYQNPSGIEGGDLDGDGDNELVVCSEGGSVVWFDNLGSGSFGAGQIVTDEPDVATDVDLADMDGDGDLDVLTTSRRDGRVAWYSNLGAAGYGPRQSVSSGVDYPEKPAIADLDGDGDLDVVAASRERLEVVWYENLGSGSFADEQVLLSVPSQARGVAVGDLDGDGDHDLLLGGDFGVVWYVKLGPLSWGPAQVLDSTTTGYDVLIADLTGDGQPEALASTGSGGPVPGASQVVAFLNLGGGSFSPPVTTGGAFGVGEFAAVDLVGSPLLDIVFLGTWYDEVIVVENRGGGQFGPGAHLYAPGGDNSTYSLDVGDLDGDGDVDLLSSGWGGLAWFENVAGTMSLVGTELSSESINGVSIADLNGNGIGDILTQGSGGVAWLPSLGGGHFGASQEISSDYWAGAMAKSADLDGNGSPDALVTDYYGHSVSWFSNLMTADCNQNGTLDGLEIASGAVEDCDGNGVPDECDLLVWMNDQDGDGQLDACVAPALSASEIELSLGAGGTQTLALTAPAAGDFYLLVGTLSGTSPGASYGGVQVPLNYDSYTQLMLQGLNQAPYTDSFGVLAPGPGGATATAVITAPAGFSSAFAGLTLHHAFVVISSGQISFASNAIPLTLVL